MSLIPHAFFPRSIFDVNQWMHPSHHNAHHPGGVVPHGHHNSPADHNSLALFDPFDELDKAVSRNFHWFNKPDFLDEMPLFPRVPQKYRITVDCAGFKPSSIKTELIEKEKKLVVSGHEDFKQEGSDDFSTKQFKKTYQLPPNAVTEKMVNFMASNGHLVIEVPLKETDTLKVQDLFPVIVDAEDGSKQVSMKFNVPENIDPSKINVSIKDHDVIFRAEDTVKRPDGVSKFHYYQRTTLPENTQVNNLRCFHENNQVVVKAPLLALEHTKSYRKVPIEPHPANPQIQAAPTTSK